jgi:hypothetical protein
MLKIDIDGYKVMSMYSLLRLFFSLPLPFEVRRSSSGKGLHIRVRSLDDDHYLRLVFDDPMRIFLDDNRRFNDMPIANLLWDNKNGMRAHPWQKMRSQKDILNFLNHFAGDRI